jgi:REP element-mobilizing transposase RayT
MLISDYQLDDLRFAYCYHAYLRWQTHWLRPYPSLARLDAAVLQSLVERFALRILECESESTEVRVLMSLQPQETLAACASKLKGQTSKWLRHVLGQEQPESLLAKGYFACTAGRSTAAQVDQYLAGQAEHHGYEQRMRPPVHVETYPLSSTEEGGLQAKHAFTVLQFHLVLATWRRRGVFSAKEAEAVAHCWCGLQAQAPFALRKVSFLPDHVHVAVCTHPSLSPGQLVVALMNAAQRTLGAGFADALIQAGVERLWQPSAYVGSFGDLATGQVQRYLRTWRARKEE